MGDSPKSKPQTAFEDLPDDWVSPQSSMGIESFSYKKSFYMIIMIRISGAIILVLIALLAITWFGYAVGFKLPRPVQT